MTLAFAIAWRNLWRNKRRTWLTAGGMAFAIIIVVASMAVQRGSYRDMIENATGLITGHIQVQSIKFVDEEEFRFTIENSNTVIEKIRSIQQVVTAAPRLQTFALVSAGERSVGAQVMGVSPSLEQQLSLLPARLKEGVYLETPQGAYIGAALARNLGVGLQDELIVLGTEKNGGVAALGVVVTGIFESGFQPIDRSLIQVNLTAMREAFALGEEAHTIVVSGSELGAVDQLVEQIENQLNQSELVVRPWTDLLPEVKQAIEVDKIGGYFFFWLLLVLVAFSVVNTFIMTVFERKKELGMVVALGMRPRKVLALVQLEAFVMWALGCGIGVLVSVVLVLIFAKVGIYLGDAAQALTTQVYMSARIYPELTPWSLNMAPLVLLVGTQLAAFVASYRLLRMRPSDAMRSE